MKLREARTGIERLATILPDGCYIAGGAARTFMVGTDDEDIKDVDLFFQSPIRMHDAIEVIRDRMNGEIIGRNGLVTRIRVDGLPDLELVGARFHQSLGSLLDSFDLVMCMFGWSRETGWRVGRAPALNDAADRVIRYNTTTSIVHTMKRIERYISRGWKTADDLWQDVARICHNTPIELLDCAGYDEDVPTDPETTTEDHSDFG